MLLLPTLLFCMRFPASFEAYVIGHVLVWRSSPGHALRTRHRLSKAFLTISESSVLPYIVVNREDMNVWLFIWCVDECLTTSGDVEH